MVAAFGDHFLKDFFQRIDAAFPGEGPLHRVPGVLTNAGAGVGVMEQHVDQVRHHRGCIGHVGVVSLVDGNPLGAGGGADHGDLHGHGLKDFPPHAGAGEDGTDIHLCFGEPGPQVFNLPGDEDAFVAGGLVLHGRAGIASDEMEGDHRVTAAEQRPDVAKEPEGAVVGLFTAETPRDGHTVLADGGGGGRQEGVASQSRRDGGDADGRIFFEEGQTFFVGEGQDAVGGAVEPELQEAHMAVFEPLFAPEEAGPHDVDLPPAAEGGRVVTGNDAADGGEPGVAVKKLSHGRKFGDGHFVTAAEDHIAHNLFHGVAMVAEEGTGRTVATTDKGAGKEFVDPRLMENLQFFESRVRLIEKGAVLLRVEKTGKGDAVSAGD